MSNYAHMQTASEIEGNEQNLVAAVHVTIAWTGAHKLHKVMATTIRTRRSLFAANRESFGP